MNDTKPYKNVMQNMSGLPTGKQNGLKCRVVLHQCLAIVVRKEGCRGDPGDFWMYENGYLLFQGLLSSNSVCWWNTGLNTATKSLVYLGYVTPGALLVGSEPCATDILKNAWSRRVLQPPAGYQIVSLEEIDNIAGTPVNQTQWTPLPEAVCAVVLRLSRQGRPAGLETIRETLMLTFPHVTPPTEQSLYDTLAQLTTDRKLYHSSNGYFIVTPERRRSRSHSRGRKRDEDIEEESEMCNNNKSMLMTTEEALMMVHGDMATIRDGDVTHQLVQTNLADVICGGNPSDKILYARTFKNHRTFPAPRVPTTTSDDRRSSFRLWRSTRRLRRTTSSRSLYRNGGVDSTSSTDGSSNSVPDKKESFLSRLFRKPRRACAHTINGQCPPSEWFNSKAVHLHSIGTQTQSILDNNREISPDDSSVRILHATSRAATLPRRRHYKNLVQTSRSRDASPMHRTANNISVCTLPRRIKGRESARRLYHKQIANPTVKNSYRTSQKLDKSTDLDNSGPSSIDSHKESSITSGPSSLESHRTVINRGDPNSNDISAKCPRSSFTLQVTTNNPSSSNSSSNSSKTNTTINNNENCSSTKIYVQNNPIRSVITFENGRSANGNNTHSVVDSSGPNVVIINDTNNTKPVKNTNLNNSKDGLMDNQSPAMNNNRKLSLQMPVRDLNTCPNVIKNVVLQNSLSELPRKSTEKTLCGGKSTETLSLNSVYGKNDAIVTQTKLEKNIPGSEPNIFYNNKNNTFNNSEQQFPSLNDLNYTFTSLAAQKILKGVGLNSVDTLVELNMTNGLEKQHNYDMVHTDFGVF